MPPKMTGQLWDALPAEVREEIERRKASITSANRSAARRRSIAAKGLGLQPKPCRTCAEYFLPTGGRQYECGSCKQKRRDADPCGPWRHKIAASSQQRWVEGTVHFKPKTCGVCNTEFIPNSGAQRWCSDPCRHRVRKVESYGITVAEYARLYESQGGRCAVCGCQWRGWGAGPKVLHIDHCHTTGRVRGLLCGDCNTAIGRFGDDPARLRQAADYLERT